MDSDGASIASNSWQPYPKDCLGLSVPSIGVTGVTHDDELPVADDGFYVASFSIDLATDAVAPYTWITAEGLSGRFDQNAFLMDTATRTVHFLTTDSSLNVSDVAAAVVVRSYKNSYLLGAQYATLMEAVKEEKMMATTVTKTGRSLKYA